MKENKGITLIALVVTIIVLLILAGVTMAMVLGNDGIFNKAEQAKEQTNDSQELGEIELAVLEAKTNSITGGSDFKTELKTSIDKVYPNSTVEKQGNNYIITLENGNQYKVGMNGKVEKTTVLPDEDLALLEKYFLDENKEGIDLITKVLDAPGDPTTWKWKDDPNSITDANTSLESANFGYAGTREEGSNLYIIYDFYMLYNDKLYDLVVKGTEDGSQFTTESIEFKYEKTGREGDTYKYDSNGDGVEENWTILYDYGEGKGIEIISPDVMGNDLTLGYNDTQATGTDNLEKSISSYNNAVKRINDYCKEQVTNPNTKKEDIRSVGSNPSNPYSENTTLYKSSNLASWAEGKYNGVGKSTDKNYEEDLIRMSYHKVANINKEYWMASRVVHEHSNVVYFDVALVYSDGAFSMDNLWRVFSSGNAYYSSPSYGVRPIVRLSNI